MSEDELKNALVSIHRLQLDVVEKTTAITGRLNSLDERQDRMEANFNMAFTSLRQNGQEIAAIKADCENHKQETRRVSKRVSQLVEKVGDTEQTGAIHIAQVKQTWKTVAVAAAFLTSLIGLALALLK